MANGSQNFDGLGLDAKGDKPIDDRREPYSKENPNRTEHTLLGLGIGAVRDTIWGAPKDESERKQRAGTNDEIAHVTADVVAALPHIKVFGAAALRAVMLHDSNATSSLQQVVGDLFNGLGGAGMNAVIKSSNFGLIQRSMMKNFGPGLAGEAGNQFLTGAAFGFTRSTLDGAQWRDENGKLDLPSGSAILTSTLVSGAIGVPAGIAGSRAAWAFAGSDSAFSRIASGMAAGTASGGIFGAADTYVQTGSLSDSARGFVAGAGIGLVTGGAAAGIERVRQDAAAKVFAKLRNVPEFTPENNLIIDRHASSPQIEEALAKHGDALSFKSQSRPISELTKELPAPEQAFYRAEIANPFGPANFWSALQFELNSYRPLRPAIQYDVGPTKLIVPSDYAKQLEAVRQYRLNTENRPIGAYEVWQQHQPLSNRVLPEELIPQLRELPDHSKIRQFQLLDKEKHGDKLGELFDPYVRWLKSQGLPTGALADAQKHKGLVRMFGRDRDEPVGAQSPRRMLKEILDHEQTHLNHDPHYGMARQIDKKIEASNYGYTNRMESEAELEAIGLLGATRAFLQSTEDAPVRMSLLARKVGDLMDKAPEAHRSTSEQTIRERINYVQEHAAPVATDKVSAYVREHLGARWQSANVSDAVELLNRLNPHPNQNLVALYRDVVEKGTYLNRKIAGRILKDIEQKSTTGSSPSKDG